MTAHVLKLRLGLLFGISNILSLGWGNGRTHTFVKKRKNWKKKCRWPWTYTHTKNRKKNQEQKKRSLKKSMFMSKIKRQIILLFYLFQLNQGRKDGSALMFI